VTAVLASGPGVDMSSVHGTPYHLPAILSPSLHWPELRPDFGKGQKKGIFSLLASGIPPHPLNAWLTWLYPQLLALEEQNKSLERHSTSPMGTTNTTWTLLSS
jgi:hypothetical protein